MRRCFHCWSLHLLGGGLLSTKTLPTDSLQVEYIFSDKTGTLTSNEMQLRQIAIKGVAYGDSDVRLEEFTPKANGGNRGLEIFDQRLFQAAQKMQRSTSLSGLVSAGGSRQDVMAYHNSFPDGQSANSLGLDDEEGPGSVPSSGEFV